MKICFSLCVCLHVPVYTYVLISECFKCYPVLMELFIVSICVCVSVYMLACV